MHRTASITHLLPCLQLWCRNWNCRTSRSSYWGNHEVSEYSGLGAICLWYGAFHNSHTLIGINNTPLSFIGKGSIKQTIFADMQEWCRHLLAITRLLKIQPECPFFLFHPFKFNHKSVVNTMLFTTALNQYCSLLQFHWSNKVVWPAINKQHRQEKERKLKLSQTDTV